MNTAEYMGEILDALAVERRRKRQDLERELRRGGPECPFDSVYLLTVAVKVAHKHGLPFKPSADVAKCFRSVQGVATLLADLEKTQEAA